MAELTDAAKREIVIRLAQFETPAEIVVALREDLGIETDTRQVGGYDPTRSYFEAGESWRELFEQTRKAFIEETAHIPAANPGYRLNLLDRLIRKAMKAGNSVLAASLLEQASKESGGVFTNKRELDVNNRSVAAMSTEDRMAALASYVAEAMDKRAAATVPAPPTTPTIN